MLPIELAQRGRIKSPRLLERYCSWAQALVIPFSMSSEEVFGWIEICMKSIGEAERRNLPIALVGVQEGPFLVTPEAVSKRAEELGVRFFVIRERHQVLEPLAYFGSYHRRPAQLASL